MSWDKKPKMEIRTYYYRSKRVNGRAVKQYIGRGPVAELTARIVERNRIARDARRLALRKERAKLAQADLFLTQARILADLLLASTLLLLGWHQHHGMWRRRRGKTKE